MHRSAITRSRLLLSLGIATTTLFLGACATVQSATRGPESASARSSAASPALNVPPGHYPRVGLCRVWIRGRPPGRQARPMRCTEALANAPAGSWVLYRASASELHARVIHAQRAGSVIAVHVYHTDGGRYLRSERPE